MILLSIFIALAAATLIGLFVKNRTVIEFCSIGASAVALAGAAVIADIVATDGTYAPFPFFWIDSLDTVAMLIIACVGFAAAVYSVGYLRGETSKNVIGSTNVAKISSRSREYFILLNLFLAMMFLAVTASSPIFTWIFIEATTLSTAFLISFYNKPSAIEAAWKYMIINSISLLMAFFGTLLYFTSAGVTATGVGLASWQTLIANAASLNPLVVKTAFIFILIGYGTKIGFAPMHTWKPDAYSKSPAPIGALFSGALLPAAFVVMLKFKMVTDAAVGPSFSQHLLIAFGLLSIAVAAFIVLISKNYKRLLAYSSIENAGIMALGFGFGGLGIFAAVLHMIYHSFIKSALFFSSGNFMLRYSSAKIAVVKGAIKAVPVTSILFLIGFFAITGAPPFGIFFTKLLILSAGMATYPAITVIVLFLAAILFLGFFRSVTSMVFGKKPEGIAVGGESPWLVIPPLALIALTLCLSFYFPPFLRTLLNNIVIHY